LSGSRPGGSPGTWKRRGIGYCIGLFREALIRGSKQAGIPIDLILPTRDQINAVVEEADCVFQEGSLSMGEYLGEFCDSLVRLRDSMKEKVI
jgi:archaeosine synthase